MATGPNKNREQGEDLIILGQGQIPPGSTPRSASAAKYVVKPLSRENSSGGFEFLPSEEGFVDSRPSSAASTGRSSRQSSASGRRSHTPTKQVALPTVRRKEETEDYSFSGLEPWQDEKKHKEKIQKHLQSGDGHDMNQNLKTLSLNDHQPLTNGDIADESTDDSSEESSEEEEKVEAPNQLLMEFVTCMMQEDYPNALKLCKMILIYEPENPEAKEFLPVIEEKMQLDAEAEEEGSDDSDSDETDDDDDDDDDDESGDDDDSADSDSEDSDEESSEETDKSDQEENVQTEVIYGVPS